MDQGHFENELNAEMDKPQTEVDSCLLQESQPESNMDGTIKIDGSVLNRDQAEYECEIRDQIRMDESRLKHCFKEYREHERKDEPVQSVASIEIQAEVKSCEYKEEPCELVIEKEQLQTEDYDYNHPRGEFELFNDKTIKIEETVLTLGISKYECFICNGIFTDKSSLEHHFNESHKHNLKLETVQSVANNEQRNEMEFLQCKNPSFKCKRDLKAHMLAHSDEKPFKCPYPGCTKSSKTMSDLKVHMNVHSEERRFKCLHPQCPMSFKRKNNLKNHMRVHSYDKSFMCRLNDQHMLVHSEEKSIKCKYPGCTKSFKYQSDLLRHMVRHSDEKPFNCKENGCTKAYKTKGELKMHSVIHSSEKLFKCQLDNCSKWYKTPKDLSAHIRVHHDKKPCKCMQTGCAKAFRSKAGLHYHNSMHNKCQNAGRTKSFKNSDDLIPHMKVHNDARVSKNGGEESTVKTEIFIKQEWMMNLEVEK